MTTERNTYKILQEDDCAPDARQHFSAEMKFLIGLTLKEFLDLAEDVSECQGEDIRKLGMFYLTIFADYPYHTLEIERSSKIVRNIENQHMDALIKEGWSIV